MPFVCREPFIKRKDTISLRTRTNYKWPSPERSDERRAFPRRTAKLPSIRLSSKTLRISAQHEPQRIRIPALGRHLSAGSILFVSLADFSTRIKSRVRAGEGITVQSVALAHLFIPPRQKRERVRVRERERGKNKHITRSFGKPFPSRGCDSGGKVGGEERRATGLARESGEREIF